MDRRDFLRSAALGSAMAGTIDWLSPAAASAAHHEAGDAGAPASASAEALAELRQTLVDLEAGFASPDWRLQGPRDLLEARRYLLHMLQHGLEVFLESNVVRPNFKRFVTPEKKLLGDNPDAIYFHSVVDAAHSYRIRGNTAGATYTSFTVELGTGEGGNSTGVGAALNDTEFEIAENGDYEILASASEQPGNWLKLPPGSGSLSTRHYYERVQGIAADRMHHIPLMIEPLGDSGPLAPPTEQSVAAGIRRVSNFLRTAIRPPQREGEQPRWVSIVPNQLPAPERTGNANEEGGFAAVDNVYSMCPFVVKPGEALVIRGRFPKCRFANVVLWNRFIQTLDYTTRQSSLNRKQTKLASDGTFRIVVAGSDPGVPNWLDTEGRMVGTVFWRFLLPEEDIEPLSTELVSIESLRGA